MPTAVLEQAYLLQALGWAIANSFWQAGVLWLIYQLITATDKRMPAFVKHQLGLVMLLCSAVWFLGTFLQNYGMLCHQERIYALELVKSWALNMAPVQQFLPVLSLIYLFALAVYSYRFLESLRCNHFVQRSGLSKAPVDMRLFAGNTALHLGIKQKIGVWISDYVDVPSVTGFLKPIILLPAAMVNQLTVKQTEAILLHELAHIRRHDYLLNLIQSVIELFLFFNPFVKLIGSATRRERENSCDDWVMNFAYDRFDYATALLVLEEQRGSSPLNLAIAATDDQKTLLQRVRRLFEQAPEGRYRASHRFTLAGLCAMIPVLMVLALPLLVDQPEQPTAHVPIDSFKHFEQPASFSAQSDARAKLEKLAANAVVNTIPSNALAKAYIPERRLKKAKKVKPAAPAADYLDAYVNEELLAPPVTTPAITLVAEKDTKDPTLLVKVEEEQSGKAQTQTYYFELNKKGINAGINIKPLIILNRFKSPLLKTVLKHFTDTLGTLPAAKMRKRVTS